MDPCQRLGEPLPRHIVLVRALPGLGDWLCAVPALRALSVALPHAAITLVGMPHLKPLVARYPQYVDEFLAFPGYPGIPEGSGDVRALPAFLARVQARRFDLAIQLHGSGSVTNPFTVLLGARYNAGCYLPGAYCPDPQRFLPYPAAEPEIWRLLHLLEFLGVPPQSADLEFPVLPGDEQALAAGSLGRLAPGTFVCVHPGASDPARCWAPAHFAAIGDALAARGLRVVLSGTAAERPITRAVAAAMRARALDLAGHTTLGVLAALLRRARLLVCNDTGISHLAAALRTPSVVIFTASELERWAPLDRRRHRPLADAPVEAVLAAAQTLLGSEAGYAA